MKLDTLFENFDLLMDASNAVPKMRDLILQLAVQGELVEQDPIDAPASKLLKRIKAEKKKLITEGKIKKQKPLSPITENETPYELPQGWEWVRLDELGEINPRIYVDNDEMGVSFIPMKMISEKYGERHSSERKKWAEVKKGFTYFMDNDVGLAKITPCFENGKSTVFKGLLNGVGAGTTELHIFRQDPKLILPEYVLIFFKCPKFLNDAKEKMTGTAGQKRVPRDFVRLVPFPLPSISEQKRIVSKVDQLMQLCDQLDACQEKASTKYTLLNDAALEKLLSSKTIDEFANHWQFICNNFDLIYKDPAHVNKLRQAILQLAVQGKLAPQDPNDEPASMLLEKIAQEKARLIKEGKIKKQKPLPEISEDEKPFNLPEGWEFVRFGAAFDVTSSKRIHVRDYVSEGVPFFRSKEIGELKNRQPISTDIFISFEKYEELGHLSGFPNIGDLMLTSVGSIGNTWICDGRDFYYKDGNITKVGSHQYADMRYVQDFIDAPLFNFQVTNTVSGTAYNALTIVKLNNLIFPLPPLAEQHRIVAKVDELMSICADLETRLNQSEKDSEMLMQAVLHEAFS